MKLHYALVAEKISIYASQIGEKIYVSYNFIVKDGKTKSKVLKYSFLSSDNAHQHLIKTCGTKWNENRLLDKTSYKVNESTEYLLIKQ